MNQQTDIWRGRIQEDEQNGLVLKAAGLTHRYGTLVAVDNVDLRVSRGESVAIVAPSGAGKSTLLRLVLGLEHQTGGSVSLNLKPSAIGVAFQENNLLPWLNVVENICLLHQLHRKNVDDSHLQKVLDAGGLEHFRNYSPRQLSTGMKQKAAISRLLFYAPKLYVLDESMANTDDLTRFYLCDALFSRVVKDNASILFVTHNLTDALHLADRILVCSPRPLQVVSEFTNPLPRERDYNIRFTREFHDAVESLRLCIEQL